MFIQLNSFTALPVAPRVELVLNFQSVAPYALNLRLDPVLCVAGAATVVVDFDVEPLLGVAGLAAFGVDFDVEPLPGVPRVAAFALDPRLDLVVNSLADPPRCRGYPGDGTRLAE